MAKAPAPAKAPRARRKVAPVTSALDKALQAAGTEAAASPVKVSPAKGGARPMGSISPYPDLGMAISMLNHRLAHASGERKALIEKWVVQLTKIHAEMIKLRKLEKLSSALTQPHQESLPL